MKKVVSIALLALLGFGGLSAKKEPKEKLKSHHLLVIKRIF